MKGLQKKCVRKKKAKRVVPQPMWVVTPNFYGISTIANKTFGGDDEE
jgi:hypothetical protein